MDLPATDALDSGRVVLFAPPDRCGSRNCAGPGSPARVGRSAPAVRVAPARGLVQFAAFPRDRTVPAASPTPLPPRRLRTTARGNGHLAPRAAAVRGGPNRAARVA